MGKITENLFKDMLLEDLAINSSDKAIKNSVKKINELYKKSNNEPIDELNLAVMSLGDFLYMTMFEKCQIFEEFEVIQRYLDLIELEQDNFCLILETLNKKEKEEVWSLIDAIKKIPHTKSLDFAIDGEAHELTIPYVEDSKEVDKLYKIAASYITLLLRKTQCVMSIVVENDKESVLIGVMIAGGKWAPIKKDYMQALHLQTLKKMGEPVPKGIKYAELKRNIKK